MTGRRVLAHIIVGVFLFGMFAWSMARPGWEKQFKATGQALEKAHSFRISIVTKQPLGESSEILEEANCPNDFHTLQRHFDKDGAIVPMQDVEVWSVGTKNVLRQNTSVMDTKGRFGGAGCGSKRMLEVPPMLNYEIILARGNGKRGGKKTVDGKTCRLWTIEMPQGGGWGELYTMCIDDDNLPLEVSTPNGAMIAHASHWNETIDLPHAPEPTVGNSN